MPICFNHKPGLVAYLTAGDPDLATTRKIALAAIDSGAEVLELGVPFSDPLADGPVIQRASERALRNGTKLADVLTLAAEIRRERPQAGLVLFSYYNPVLRFGLERFCATAEQAGVDGVLITDMIVEEADEYLRHLRAHHLAPIFLAAPTSPDERLERIAKASQGFVYAISRTGITGTQQQLASDAEQLVKRLRRFTDLPIAVGFGISNADHVAAVSEFADAAVVGSALVALIEKSTREEAPSSIARFIKGLRQPVALAR
ncbi:tryptophan synthase subunit alpha [Pseudacidobacterium ailaaui]|jgi:tryptophan synthase alpha chain|uniref:tryptophan synthase subunit alpha n=1 Tax=Pseudacidobacterium ailaaui TaxID=1382359 RepID=UPI000479EE5C|nr:tryptophan synthase subunit alpha [Pseudacidobacterium ailaaui]MBX6359795.1 tryptophan synthase subunit alpha [Pseudacidobacterium ailaaui]MDI3255662.1 tryptophan synthase subunit alpha [Bacillota bacterium]